MKDMTEMKRIINAERACKNAKSDWGKKYWYDTFRNCVRNIIEWYTLIGRVMNDSNR